MHKTGVTWSLIIVLFKSLTAATWIVCICNWCFWRARIHSSVVIKADGYKSINNKHFGLNLKWLRGFILVVVSYLFYSFSKFFIESRPLSSAWHWLHLWTTDVWILWFIDYHITQSDVCLCLVTWVPPEFDHRHRPLTWLWVLVLSGRWIVFLNAGCRKCGSCSKSFEKQPACLLAEAQTDHKNWHSQRKQQSWIPAVCWHLDPSVVHQCIGRAVRFVQP